MNKIKLLIAILIIINVFLFALVYVNKEKTPIQPNQVTPTPQQTLTVTSLTPPTNQLSEISLVASISVNFNQVVDQSSVIIQTNPIVETRNLVSANALIIKPKPVWPIGETIDITIVQARGIDGSNLEAPYKFTIKSPIPSD